MMENDRRLSECPDDFRGKRERGRDVGLAHPFIGHAKLIQSAPECPSLRTPAFLLHKQAYSKPSE